MKTTLVSITKPLVEGLQNAEDIITYCARVSNPSNQLNLDTAPKLIRYLIDHKHWSPFEMVDMTVEIVTSRAIAAQILRHKTANFAEFSLRYSKSTTCEPIELRLQGKTNRQVGDEPVLDDDLQKLINTFIKQSFDLYNQLTDAGIAKECARMVLPLATQTTLYMKATIRTWIHYIELRIKSDTQKEHRDIAKAIKQIFIQNFPETSKALNWN